LYEYEYMKDFTQASSKTRNLSGDEIANVNFLRRHRSRTTAHNKVHFVYGKDTMSTAAK